MQENKPLWESLWVQYPCPNYSAIMDIFDLGSGCRCPDCWNDDPFIREEMRYAGALLRRADAALSAAGFTAITYRDHITGEWYEVRMGQRGIFPVSPVT